MLCRFYKISIILTSFIFLTGFMPITSLIGPGATIISSGNVYKAGAQFYIDQQIKKKTGKNSLAFFKEEVTKKKEKKNFNEDFKKLVENRIEKTHKKILEQNNNKEFRKKFKLLVEKRIKNSREQLSLE